MHLLQHVRVERLSEHAVAKARQDRRYVGEAAVDQLLQGLTLALAVLARDDWGQSIMIRQAPVGSWTYVKHNEERTHRWMWAMSRPVKDSSSVSSTDTSGTDWSGCRGG
jgi:hypothetical protein